MLLRVSLAHNRIHKADERFILHRPVHCQYCWLYSVLILQNKAKMSPPTTTRRKKDHTIDINNEKIDIPLVCRYTPHPVVPFRPRQKEPNKITPPCTLDATYECP